ncbi:MAG: DUF349 domain-containing protein [Deltaproteobacteria bacterium]|nr:DUF349 domain-containing protein [Deltaproteobacteria bacterium]
MKPMGFFDLFRPKWRHSDAKVRSEAVRELGHDQVDILIQIAKRDEDARIRKIAIKKLEDPSVLREIAADDPDEGLRRVAEEKASELLVTQALSQREDAAAIRALGLVVNQRDLGTIARQAASPVVRQAALARIQDERILVDVAHRADHMEERIAAVGRIRDVELLRDIVLAEEHKPVALAALSKLSDPRALEAVAKNAKNKAARSAAREKLPREEARPAKKSAASSSEQKTRKARLLQACLGAEAWSKSTDWDAALSALSELQVQWSEIGQTPGDAPLVKRFEKALHEFELRKAAMEKEAALRAAAAEAKARKARERAKNQAQDEPKRGRHEKVAQSVAEDVPARTAEAAPAIEAGEAPRAEAAVLPPARPRIDPEHEQYLVELDKACVDLEKRLTTKDIKAAERALKGSQAVLRRARASESEKEIALRSRLTAAKEQLAKHVGELKEAESWKRWANIPKLEELCMEAEALVQVLETVDDKRRAPVVLKELQARWKSAGPGPAEKSQALWERFKNACDMVYEKCKEYFAKLDEERVVNLKRKEELCEKAEALSTSEDWKEAGEQIKKLQEEWKGIGPVPQEQADPVWKRFRAACDVFFARRKAHDQVRDEERAENLKRKEELCERAESMAGSTDWKETARRFKGLQEEWQKVGPVPREQADSIWERFRAACDKFFDARKAALAKQDEERVANMAKKEQLCQNVQALADSDDHDTAVETVKKLMREWKTIGPVPRDQSDALWKRFRGACDAVMEGPKLTADLSAVNDTAGFTNRIPLEKLVEKASPAEERQPKNEEAPEKAPEG